MENDHLGRLTSVGLRDVWPNEASDFTPWLVRGENLDTLSHTLDIDLELNATEKNVGPFRADILCKEKETDTLVLIENQLDDTDHRHLGQLLTYASGLDAAKIIWIAGCFIEEHRAAMDWLNTITNDNLKFFGLEIELWRIGDSPVAPKFNIVSKPNDWSRSFRQAARAVNAKDLSEAGAMQLSYWNDFHEELKRVKGPISGDRRPPARTWMQYSIGHPDFFFRTAIVPTRNQIRVALHITGDNAKAFFHLLLEQRNDIEKEFDGSLEWEYLPNRKEKRIAVYMNADPNDKQKWPEQHKWLATEINKLHKVFHPRVSQLNPDDWQPDPEADSDTNDSQ